MSADRQAPSLSEMSLEELWKLFPVFLVEPNADWIRKYQKIDAVLKDALKCRDGLREPHRKHGDS